MEKTVPGAKEFAPPPTPPAIDPVTQSILVAVCVVLLTIVFYLIYLRGKAVRRTVLLTGVSGSGKTLIFTRLVHEKYAETYTSMKENTADYVTTKGKSVFLVDIPGPENIRYKYLDKHKSNTRAFVYVVDSLTCNKDIRNVAEYLYILLTDPELGGKCSNALILCNKQDEMRAKKASSIKTALQDELNTLRTTKASQLSGTEESGETTMTLGKEGSKFTFDDHFINVEFLESHAVDGEKKDSEPNLNDLISWINKVA